MSWFFRNVAVTILGVAALQAQTTHRAVSSIFASHLASGIARADTLTLAPTLRATQPVLQAFLGGQRLSVGTWIEIYGDNFAATAKDWTTLFQGDTAPTLIDETRVTIDGKPAFLSFVTPAANGNPSQIRALVPDAVGIGDVLLEVITPVGRASTTVRVSQATPAMLTTPAFNVGGKQYVQAVFGDNLGAPVYVGPPNLVTGLNFRPAKPGDIITIFAVGCGPTNPATVAGNITRGLVRIPQSSNLQVLIGQAVAPAEGFLSPGSVGLCQLNVTVPNVGDGDLPITTSISSASDGQNLFITVQR